MIPIHPAARLQLGILASGRGSNFDAIYQAVMDKRLDADIRILISDKGEAPALQKARERGIEAVFIDPGSYPDREAYETVLVDTLRQQGAEVIVLAGYMRLVGKTMLQAYRHRIVNIHPALLPSFTGLHAQQQAIDYGVRFSGCTVHLVDEGMDTGPIIMQAVVPVLEGDREDDLSARILTHEHQIYWQSLQLMAQGRLFLEGRKVYIKPQ